MLSPWARSWATLSRSKILLGLWGARFFPDRLLTAFPTLPAWKSWRYRRRPGLRSFPDQLPFKLVGSSQHVKEEAGCRISIISIEGQCQLRGLPNLSCLPTFRKTQNRAIYLCVRGLLKVDGFSGGVEAFDLRRTGDKLISLPRAAVLRQRSSSPTSRDSGVPVSQRSRPASAR